MNTTDKITSLLSKICDQKHSSLFFQSKSKKKKKSLITFDSRCQCYKTFCTRYFCRKACLQVSQGAYLNLGYFVTLISYYLDDKHWQDKKTFLNKRSSLS
jgi:hypothetical protein